VPAGGEAEIAELVGRARKGDRAAFSAIVKRLKERAIRTAYHLTGNWSDADDVAQEAFVRAYRGLASFDGRSELTTWLHRIIINCALNFLRTRRRQAAGVAGVARLEPPAGDDPRARVESRELVKVVLEALAAMSPSLRVTLVLATVENMPYKDIAQALEVPEGTVAWRVNQARKLLRMRLAELAPNTRSEDVDAVLRRAKEALGGP
jgi:RNA polymerase sigma-70 factor (ECF subfamily)